MKEMKDIEILVAIMTSMSKVSDFDESAMYDECPFYAYIAMTKDATLKSQLRYDTDKFKFDLKMGGCHIKGELLRESHKNFDPSNQHFLHLLPDTNYAGAFARVCATGSKIKVVSLTEKMLAHYDTDEYFFAWVIYNSNSKLLTDDQKVFMKLKWGFND